MNGNRMDRINSEIQKTISNIISGELSNPIFSNQLISVSKVDTSPDFSQSKIYISIFGDDNRQNEVFDALRNCSGYIRKRLSFVSDMKKTPKLLILLDKTMDNASRIEEILSNIKGTKHE